MRGLYFHVPAAELSEPRSGECIVGAWWLQSPEGLLFWTPRRRPAPFPSVDDLKPQCNGDRVVTETIGKKLHPDHEVVQVPVVYLSHAVRRMVEAQRKAAQ